MLRPFLLILLCLLTLGTQAQVFKHVDEDGNVTFTDQPPPDSTEVQINSTNIAAPPPSDAFPTPPPSDKPDKDTDGAYKITITGPANETIIPNGPGNFTVSASVSPELADTHQLQLLLDGAPREEPQRSSSWALTNVFRGEHNLVVSVVDAKGKSLAKSDPVTVFVFRPSSNNTRRNRPPRPTPTR